jgi:WD40 repeat protein
MISSLPFDDVFAGAALVVLVATAGALLPWKTARPVVIWILVMLVVPIAVAFTIDAWCGHAMRVLIPHSAPITAMTVSADESLFAVADQKGIIRVTRTDSVKYAKKGVRALYFVTRDADGKALNPPGLLAVNGAGAFELYDPASGKTDPVSPLELSQSQQQTQAGLQPVSELNDEAYVTSTMNKGGIVAAVRASSDTDLENAYEIHFFNRDMPPLRLTARPTAIAPYEGTLAATTMSNAVTQPLLLGFEDGTVGIVWQDAGRGAYNIKGSVLAKGAAPKPIVKVASSTRNHIASVDSDGAISIWRLGPKNGQPEKLWDTETRMSEIGSALLTQDERRILSWSADGTLRLWDAATGQQIGPAMKHEGPVGGAVLTRDERRILSWSADGPLRLWDVATGQQIGPAMKHDSAVRGAVLTRDERRILSWSDDGTLGLWDAATGRQIGPAMKHDAPVGGAVFTNNEQQILSWSDDGALRLWDAATGAALGLLSALRCQGCAFLGIDEVRNAVEAVDAFGHQARLDLSSGQQIGSDSPKSLPVGVLFVNSDNHALLYSLDNGSVKLASSGSDLPPHTALISHVLSSRTAASSPARSTAACASSIPKWLLGSIASMCGQSLPRLATS